MVSVPSRLDVGACGSSPTRRRSSAKLGPGSSVGENIGIVTSGRLLAPLAVPRHVHERQRDDVGIVAQVAQRGLAARIAADLIAAVLLGQHPVVVLVRTGKD